jgi:AraC-like DNA-binding protein
VTTSPRTYTTPWDSIELADRYLKQTDLCVPEISHLLGFRDTSSFFRAFHSWTGTTPGAIRSDERRRAGGP